MPPAVLITPGHLITLDLLSQQARSGPLRRSSINAAFVHDAEIGIERACTSASNPDTTL
jgi:hypothetical protein